MIQFFNQIIQQLSGNGGPAIEGTINPGGEMQLHSADKPTFTQSLFSFLGGKEATEQVDPGILSNTQLEDNIPYKGLTLFVPSSQTLEKPSNMHLHKTTEAILADEEGKTLDNSDGTDSIQLMALFKSQSNTDSKPSMELRVVDTSQWSDNTVQSDIGKKVNPTTNNSNHLTLVKSSSELVQDSNVQSKNSTPIPQAPVTLSDQDSKDSIQTPVLTRPVSTDQVLPKVEGATVSSKDVQSITRTEVAVNNEGTTIDRSQQQLFKSVSEVEQRMTKEALPHVQKIVREHVTPRTDNQLQRSVYQKVTAEEIKIRESIQTLQNADLSGKEVTGEVQRGFQKPLSTNSSVVIQKEIIPEEHVPVVSEKTAPPKTSIQSEVKAKQELPVRNHILELVETERAKLNASGTKPEVNKSVSPTLSTLVSETQSNDAKPVESATSTVASNTEIAVGSSSASSTSKGFSFDQQNSGEPVILEDSTSVFPKEILERKDFSVRFTKVLQQQQVFTPRTLNTETFQPHTFILDNGEALNVAAKQTEGVLTLQIEAGNQDIIRIIQQNSDEIKVQLQKQLDVEIDLQLNDFDKQDGNSDLHTSFKKNAQADSRSVQNTDEIVDENNSTPTESVKYLGFNKNEWVG